MMYTALYMAATRTQVYLTAEQRRKIDDIRERDGRTLAQVIRDALDAYLESNHIDAEKVLEETFGIAPDFTVPPRSEWNRREDRIWERRGERPR